MTDFEKLMQHAAKKEFNQFSDICKTMFDQRLAARKEDLSKEIGNGFSSKE